MAELADAAARVRIQEDLDTTLFVEAAAGTGKTTALVSRIVALLADGRAELEQVVALTFSERAAAEMKLRLRAEIERARAGSLQAGDALRSERLERALEQLEVAHIDTIHAFCSDLLREFPLAAGVDPLFEVAAEEETSRFVRDAFDRWFEAVLDDPPPGVRRVLRRRTGGFAQPPREQLLGAANTLIENRDFGAQWSREPFGREAAIDAVIERLEEIGGWAAEALHPDDYLARSVAAIAHFCEELEILERVRGRDHDALEARLRSFARERLWGWKGFAKRVYSEAHSRDQVIASRDAAKRALDEALLECEADLAPLLREELRDVVLAYEDAKREAGQLDFLDLLLRARDLVRDDAEVRRELADRYRYFLVDEFQDTDPLQVELLLLLAADDPDERDARATRATPGKLFVVGDPKQSIYRFRRADIAIYRDVLDRLCEQGAERLHLSASFRSVASIQDFANAAFALPMETGAANFPDSQAPYTALDRVRDDAPEQPAVVALPVPAPYSDWGKVTARSIDESLPDAVGAFVDWLCNESAWTVEEEDPDEPGTQRRVPIEARHVCILFRRLKRFREDVTRDYVRALEVRGLPHVVLGGRSFHEREEVLALRNALCAIEWPDDALRVYAVLRGPLFAIGDDQLLAFRHRRGALHPLRRWAEASDPPLEAWEREVTEALELLGRLHIGRNHRSIAETLNRLLGAVRAHAGIAVWPTGEQALANCARVVDLARRFERHAARSFRAFVERLEEQAESGEAQDAPVVEDGSDGVRLMTVHKAKGLEFPVVILADPTCRATHERPDRTTDIARGLFATTLCGCAPRELQERSEIEQRRDRDEALRVAYVAATRARDLLVVPSVGDAPGVDLCGIEDQASRWLDVLAPALFPEPEFRRSAAAAPDAFGLPLLGPDSVFVRPGRAPRSSDASVEPGLHAAQRGDQRVVWWSPKALALGKEDDTGLRQERLLHADASAGGDDRGAEEHEAWQQARRSVIEAGRAASLNVSAVTTAVRSEPRADDSSAGPAVEIERVDRAGDARARPGGRRFGTLVHAVLAEIPFDADAVAVRERAVLDGRIVGASADEVDAAATAVLAALAHPLMQRAAALSGDSACLHRESPLWLRRDDGTLYEGIVDLAFREQPRGSAAVWSVIDFKTDADPGAHLAEYEAQVRLYAEAIGRATGEATRPILFLV